MDTSAFEEIYETHRAAVERHAARFVGQADVADIAQEVFVAAYRALRDGETVAHMGAWLRRIATNRALDRLRSPDQRLRSGATPEEHESRGPLSSLPVVSVEDQAARAEMGACVRAIVDRLPDPQRTVLVLSEFDGHSDGEIAALVGTSVGNVKIRLHRARARLRDDLARCCRLYSDSRNEIACEPVSPMAEASRVT